MYASQHRISRVLHIHSPTPKSYHFTERCLSHEPREDQGVREVFPHIGPVPIIIPLNLFLDLLRDPVFPRRLSDSQSYAMNFTHVDS